MLPGSPLLWLAIVGLVSAPVTYGVTRIRADMQIKVAYGKGVEAGKSAASAGAVTEVTKTAEAFRQAEAETPLPIDQQAIKELCKKRSSCRERAQMK